MGETMQAEHTEHRRSEQATPAAMLRMAGWHALAGDPLHAERCYRQVLEREPYNVAALQCLALLLKADTARTQESLHLLATALTLEPRNPALHTSRAVVLNCQERPLDALDSFADAVGCAPHSPHTLYNLG